MACDLTFGLLRDLWRLAEADPAALANVRFTATEHSLPSSFRIGPLAYLPDAVALPEAAWAHLHGLSVWVVDALRRKPHPTPTHLAMTLGWIARAQPERAVLTNMHLDMDYATLCAELPKGVEPAYDGMVITFENQR